MSTLPKPVREAQPDFVPLNQTVPVSQTTAKQAAPEKFGMRTSVVEKTESFNAKLNLVSSKRQVLESHSAIQRGVESVSAVVIGISEDTVTLRCKLPNSYVEIDLPKALVPGELSKYGAPVSIDIAPDSKYRSLRVTRRVPDAPVASAELEELNRWIESEF